MDELELAEYIRTLVGLAEQTEDVVDLTIDTSPSEAPSFLLETPSGDRFMVLVARIA